MGASAPPCGSVGGFRACQQGSPAPASLRPSPTSPGASRDTLKPKMLLCSCRSLFSRVLFPAPEGPLRTTGLGPDIPVAGDGGDKYQQGLAPYGSGRGGCSAPTSAPSEFTPEIGQSCGQSLRAMLKPWLCLPLGVLPGNTCTDHKCVASPAVHSYPTVKELLGGACPGPNSCVSWHHTPEVPLVKVSGTQALFWELPLKSKGLTTNDHSFLTPLL